MGNSKKTLYNFWTSNSKKYLGSLFITIIDSFITKIDYKYILINNWILIVIICSILDTWIILNVEILNSYVKQNLKLINFLKFLFQLFVYTYLLY